MKLSKAQRLALASILDWSADWEVAERMGCTSARSRCQVAPLLYRLHRMGLADFIRANFVYRANEAGRAALATKEPTHD